MSGKTDPQIVREYLALMESDDPGHLPSILQHLERELAAAAAEITRDGSPCPGAVELLEALAKDDRFYSSVLTGNIAPTPSSSWPHSGWRSGWTWRRAPMAATVRTAGTWSR